MQGVRQKVLGRVGERRMPDGYESGIKAALPAELLNECLRKASLPEFQALEQESRKSCPKLPERYKMNPKTGCNCGAGLPAPGGPEWSPLKAIPLNHQNRVEETCESENENDSISTQIVATYGGGSDVTQRFPLTMSK